MSYSLQLDDGEYRVLVRALRLADEMANGFDAKGRDSHPEIGALAKKVGTDDKVDSLTRRMIDRYTEAAMFDELAHLLAERDIHEKLDHDPDVREEDYDNRDGLEAARTDEYFKEFEDHGLDRVVVNRRRYVPCDDARRFRH